ncbi:deoxycytidine triphosphate deaminase [Myxococcus stipitatus DSM 14675]|uniref:Deoxycytidine triphosphate deaminase n=1 Tax=Myxococcus stipitatus (strain DSM 14675 / JCM 12634 / Mx s8) TaxID=1278073 RepID=L7U4W3_MYXSD|nr:dCTP deaminase [Myxococcus stipitatus]AGC42875.1 deoxycytidine triphosphate deaminase [Myxococcus stipitatus DSM 14675]
MPLSDKEIKSALEAGALKIEPIIDENIRPSSYDVTLGNELAYFVGNEPIDLSVDPSPRTERHDLTVSPYVIPPNGFVLGSVREWIEFGPYCGFISTRTTYARMGLLFSVSNYANPGYKGNLPLAIANLSGLPVTLTKGLRVAQVVFLRTGEVERPYSQLPDAKYLGERGVSLPKPHLDREIQQALSSLGLRGWRMREAQRLIDEKTDKIAETVVGQFTRSVE